MANVVLGDSMCCTSIQIHSSIFDALLLREFLWVVGLVSQLLSAVSYAILVAYFLALKPAVEVALGRMLFSFRGRVKRQFFWIVSLTLLAVNIIAWVITSDLSGKNSRTSSSGVGVIVAVICILLWFLVSVWISLATQVKRWHDLDKSGWWVLIGLIPIIGTI